MEDDFIDIGTLSVTSVRPDGDDGFPDMAHVPTGATSYIRVDASVAPLTGYPAPVALLGRSDRDEAVVVTVAETQPAAVAEPQPSRDDNVDEQVDAWTHLFGSTVIGSSNGGAAGPTAADADILAPDQFSEAPLDAAAGVTALQQAAASTSLSSELYGSMRAALDDVLAAAGLPAVPSAPAAICVSTAAPAVVEDDFAALLPAAPLRIAVCQLHAASADPVASIQRIQRILVACCNTAGCKPDVAVFPETFLGGYHLGGVALLGMSQALPSAAEVAAAVATPELSRQPLLAAAQLAARHGIALVVPFVERGAAPDARNPTPALPPLYNSVCVFDSDGSVLRVYRKCHLWGTAYEQRLFTSGPGPCDTRDPFHPFTLRAWPQLPMGVLVCFDNEFAEPARMLAARGCKLVFAVMASGDLGGFSPTCMIPVRAAENHMAYAYCNYPSSLPPPVVTASPTVVVTQASEAIDVSYSGGSAVFAPTGRPITAAPVYACVPTKRAAPQAVLERLYVRDDDERAAMERLRVTLGDALAADEYVLLANYDPEDPAYVLDESRNPYLAERRVDLYSLL